jgi:tyrosyl-tRNA synthetase
LYYSFSELNLQLTPQALKLGVSDALNALLEPIRQEFATNRAFREAYELAYPQPEKKVKKGVKDKGSKYPGKKNAEDHPANGEQTEDVSAKPRVSDK